MPNPINGLGNITNTNIKTKIKIHQYILLMYIQTFRQYK